MREGSSHTRWRALHTAVTAGRYCRHGDDDQEYQKGCDEREKKFLSLRDLFRKKASAPPTTTHHHHHHPSPSSRRVR